MTGKTQPIAAVSMAVAVPAVIAGAPTADPKAAIDLFANALLGGNIAAISEDDDYVVFAVKVPREASPGHDDLVALADDDEFGADLAAWMAARIRPT